MFGKRFNIITIGGFRIGVDISWFFIALLLSWTLAVGYFPAMYPKLATNVYWLMGISGMLGLFICIILHELGHAVVARHYDLPISQITLFIFGGVAELKKEPSSPKVEFLMAIAGPIVSFLIAFLTFGLTRLGLKQGWPVAITGVTTYLAMINFLLAIFNLIPAFPLDGGRIFRALLWWWKKNLAWATRVSSLIGMGFGFSLIFLGIFNIIARNFLAGFWMIILGWFLQRAASSVQSQFYVSRELEGETVAKFMKINPVSVPPNISIKAFVEQYVYTSHHHLYPVTQENKLLGYVSLQEVKAISHPEWETTLVSSIMVPSSPTFTVTPKTSALTALEMLQEAQPPFLFVVDKGHLVGILSAQDLFKLISLKLELGESEK